MIAYGLDDSVKYWTIQNSWGPDWADGGYARIIRGNNLAGIEDGAYYMRAWVEGVLRREGVGNARPSRLNWAGCCRNICCR